MWAYSLFSWEVINIAVKLINTPLGLGQKGKLGWSKSTEFMTVFP